MLFKPLRIPISQKIFEEHLRNLLLMHGPKIILNSLTIGEYRRRYTLSFPSDPKPLFSEKSFCQIDTLPLSKNRTEVIVCAIQLEKGNFYKPFFNGFLEMVYRNWFPEKTITTNFDPIWGRMLNIRVSFDLPLDANLHDEFEDPELEGKRRQYWEAIDRTLPALEKYPESEHQAARPSYLPKKPETNEKWRRIYEIVVRLREEYLDDFDVGRTKDPEPTYDDLREAIASEIGVKPGERTLRKVIRAGEDGQLKE